MLFRSEPKNSLIKQYTRLFELDNIKVTFEEEALNFIVDKAIDFKLGARGLRSIIEGIMNDAMFELPSDNAIKALRITETFVEEQFLKTSMARLKVA